MLGMEVEAETACFCLARLLTTCIAVGKGRNDCHRSRHGGVYWLAVRSAPVSEKAYK